MSELHKSKKGRISNRVKNNWFTHNLLLKLIALALAIIIWFYINGELSRERRELQWRRNFLELAE